LLTRQQHHVAADGAAQVALFQEVLGEFVELGDLAVAFICELIDGQEALFGIEGAVSRPKCNTRVIGPQLGVDENWPSSAHTIAAVSASCV